MGKAVDPKKRRKRPNAAAVAKIYTIYVNPQASKQNDPEGLQALVHPILESWCEEGILKEKLMEAVLAYTGQASPKAKEDTAYLQLFENYMKQITRLIKELPVGGTASAYQAALITEIEELHEDIEEFGETMLLFGDSDDD